jgi:hypothetical protein
MATTVTAPVANTIGLASKYLPILDEIYKYGSMSSLLDTANERVRWIGAKTANIFTMNCPEEMMKKIGYPAILEENTNTLRSVFGACETLYAFNTYQFADYSRYDITLFSEEAKRAYRDEHFKKDLENAKELGSRLVWRAKEHLE